MRRAIEDAVLKKSLLRSRWDDGKQLKLHKYCLSASIYDSAQTILAEVGLTQKNFTKVSFLIYFSISVVAVYGVVFTTLYTTLLILTPLKTCVGHLSAICNFFIIACDSAPCQNGGQCYNDGYNSILGYYTTYRCECPPFWGGKSCDVSKFLTVLYLEFINIVSFPNASTKPRIPDSSVLHN